MSKPTKRLLILEDDLAVAQTLAHMAERLGFEVKTSEHAHDFFATNRAWSPTHIVVDLAMPGLDGVEVLQLLSVGGSQAQVIVTSGMGRQVLDSASRAGAARGLRILGVLPKPFTMATLSALLTSESPAHDTAQPAVEEFVAEETSLANALAQHELKLKYQPRIALATRALVGFDAMLHWDHPLLGMLPPERFLPSAARLPLLEELTTLTVREALEGFSRFAAGKDLTLGIGISARSLERGAFADDLATSCRGRKIAPSSVVLNISDSIEAQHSTDALDTLTRLRVKGFQLAIDDFGTGHASLRELSRLPFSQVRIGKGFVQEMTASSGTYAVIQSVIELAKTLNLTTLAEGVEDKPTFALLWKIGCDLALGGVIARPMADDAVPAWIERWSARKR